MLHFFIFITFPLTVIESEWKSYTKREMYSQVRIHPADMVHMNKFRFWHSSIQRISRSCADSQSVGQLVGWTVSRFDQVGSLSDG